MADPETIYHCIVSTIGSLRRVSRPNLNLQISTRSVTELGLHSHEKALPDEILVGRVLKIDRYMDVVIQRRLTLAVSESAASRLPLGFGARRGRTARRQSLLLEHTAGERHALRVLRYIIAAEPA